MEPIKLPQAAKLTSPNPVTVVCTEKPDGTQTRRSGSGSSLPLCRAVPSGFPSIAVLQFSAV